VTRLAQDPPWHRDLGDVEIAIGKRQQHAHQAIISLAAAGTSTGNDTADLGRARPGMQPQTIIEVAHR
jgi:hypothetical protein